MKLLSIANICGILVLAVYSTGTTASAQENAAQPLLSLDGCHGLEKPLTVVRGLPYMDISIGSSTGKFALDFADTHGSIDLDAFPKETRPKESGVNPNASDQFLFSNFNFFVVWDSVSLKKEHRVVENLGFAQSGIIGASFFPLNAYSLNYEKGEIWRSFENGFCSDEVLRNEGFSPTSTQGYFANDTTKLKEGYRYNVPTVPIRIGTFQAVAQLDTAYDDSYYPHAVNVNQAFVDALKAVGVILVEANKIPPLKVCGGIEEPVVHYKLPVGSSFQIIGTDNQPIVSRSDVDILLKQTPKAALRCQGIGTWKIPAALIGASYSKMRRRWSLTHTLRVCGLAMEIDRGSATEI